MSRSKRRSIASIATCAAMLCCLSTTIARAADSSAAQDAQQKIDAGQYDVALRIIAQALTKERPNDDSGDRYQLLMLRGECLLHINQRAAAGTAFDMAGKSAPDVAGAALARANALLSRASPQNKYTPKSSSAGPIDILNPVNRKVAFGLLRDDLDKALQPKLQKALQGDTLPPMIDVLPSLMDLGYLEYAAQGSADQMKSDLMALGKRARVLMQSELRRVRHSTDVLEDVSNSSDGYARRGLYSNERNDLQASHDYVMQIGDAARHARRRAMDLGADGAVWEPIIADAADLADRQQAMLNAGP